MSKALKKRLEELEARLSSDPGDSLFLVTREGTYEGAIAQYTDKQLKNAHIIKITVRKEREKHEQKAG